MAYWLYSFNVPLVMNNFIYLVMFAAFAVGFGFLIYAAKQFKKLETQAPEVSAVEVKEEEVVATPAE